MTIAYGETDEDITPLAMKQRLEKAITRAGLGVPSLLPTDKRARHALRLVGSGGVVDFDAPVTVRRAITILENIG
jgi:hypothetical protein